MKVYLVCGKCWYGYKKKDIELGVIYDDECFECENKTKISFNIETIEEEVLILNSHSDEGKIINSSWL